MGTEVPGFKRNQATVVRGNLVLAELCEVIGCGAIQIGDGKEIEVGTLHVVVFRVDGREIHSGGIHIGLVVEKGRIGAPVDKHVQAVDKVIFSDGADSIGLGLEGCRRCLLETEADSAQVIAMSIGAPVLVAGRKCYCDQRCCNI